MDDNRAEPIKRIADLLLTSAQGKRLLVNAFDIAMVEERDEGATLTLKVPVATGSTSSYSAKTGLQVQVKESLDTIAQLRAKL